MSIASRIESIANHLENDWQSVANLGADTSFDKNIENIAAALDGVYEELPKVTGEGTSISLSPTKKGGIKLDLKGNTSQETTTQSKNLMPNEAESQTLNGLTITKGTDGSLLINGTSTATTKIVLGITNLASGTYTLSTHKEGTVTDSCYLRTVDTTTGSEISGTSYNVYSSNSKTYTLSENKRVQFDFYTGGNRTFTDFKIYPMAESGSTATDYVEFVPNSPSPDYPQNIHVVSGDNSIDVCGKNLFKEWVSGSVDGQGNFTPTSRNRTNYIQVQPNTTYTLWRDDTGFATYIYQYNASKNYIKQNVITSANTTLTLTTDENTKYVVLYQYTTYSPTNKAQLEVGSTATTYEPYKGQSYPINLPVENLINSSLFTISGSYNVTSINNGEVTSSSLSGYAGVRIELGQNINLKTNDVIYVRLKIKSDVAGDIFNTIQLFNSSNAVITTTDTKVLTPTLTTEYQEYIMKYVLGIDDVLRRLFIQHKGSTSNVFTIKDIQVSYVNGSYTPYGTTPIELCKIGDYQDYIYKDNKKWYKYGAVGKVVLDGSENWWQDRELTNTYRYYTGQIIPSSVQNVAYSDNFKSVTTYTVNNTDTEALCRINEGQIAIRLNKTRATTLAEFKTWLGTHNTVVYYALTTPEATEITDSTLISQLDTIKRSYDEQTNITQVNNDLPFELTASALLDANTQINHLEAQIEALS